MIQRKQTLYLLASIILTAVCLSLPLGEIEPKGIAEPMVAYSLFIKGSTVDFLTWPLFAIMIVLYPISITTIAMFKKRILQAKLCIWAVAVIFVWYAYFLYLCFIRFVDMGTFHAGLATYIPLLTIICYLLARKGIMDDEKLVRSADRIR